MTSSPPPIHPEGVGDIGPPDATRKAAFLDTLSSHLCVFGGWALIGLSLLIAFEVIARKFFAFSIQGADEIGGFVFAVTTTIGFTYTLYRRAHIRIEILLGHLPILVQSVLNVLAYALLGAFIWIVIWRVVLLLAETIEFNIVAPTPLATPLVIPQSLWLGGLVLFGIAVFGCLLRGLLLMARGKFADVVLELGVSSTEDKLTDDESKDIVTKDGS